MDACTQLTLAFLGSAIGSILGGLLILIVDAAYDTIRSWYRAIHDYFRPPETLTFPAEWLLEVFRGPNPSNQASGSTQGS